MRHYKQIVSTTPLFTFTRVTAAEMSDLMKPPNTAEDIARLPPPPSNDAVDFEEATLQDDEDMMEVVTANAEGKKDGVLQRELTNHKLSIASNVIFVIAASLYVAMEITYLPYYRFYRDVPYAIRESENDDLWWQYYNDTEAFPPYLDNATEQEWGDWFNNSFLDEDAALNEFVFQVPNADEKYADPEETYEAWVSQYMILYSCAAFGFLLTGILEYTIATRNNHFWGRILYCVMIVAALFGLMSAMLVNKDPWGSTVLDSVSVHLFAVEAVAIVIARWRQTRRIAQSDEYDEDFNHGDFHKGSPSKLGTPIRGGILSENSSACVTGWLFFGDAYFVIGTTGDVVLSYFYIFEEDFLEQCVAAIATASFWLLAALVYLSVAAMDCHDFRQIMKADLQEQGQNMHPAKGQGDIAQPASLESQK